MANELDELNAPVNPQGRDVNVIEKQLPIKVGVGSTIFEVLLWVLGIIPGIVFLFMKINAKKYFNQEQQKLQHNASQIDNFLEQRVVILENCASLLDKAIDLDKDVMINVAKFRSGSGADKDTERNELGNTLEAVSRQVNIAFERYPELKSHKEIADAMQQNNYLQREITAAREVYNDSVLRWNRAVYEWPTKMIVAARNGYTTRIPFSVSAEIKEKARSNFFK